jgi:CHAD domain-containing protein
MRSTRSPRSVLQDQLSRLVTCLPDIREGQDEAIHDARVATRRIREALVLSGANLDGEESSPVAGVVQRAAAALGKARDSDVILDLLNLLEERVSTAGPLVAKLRRDLARARQKTRRRLIKEIETLDLAAIPQLVARSDGWSPFHLPFGQAGWRERLREHIAERAVDVRQSIEHASGVYFPNRSHAARLAMKKLRYALELAQETGAWNVQRAIRRLRKAQDVLGKAHDREVLLGRLKPLAQEDAGADRGAAESLVVFLEADILALHRRYLGMRSEIAAICDACERSRRRRRPARALLAAGAALPALMLLAYPAASAPERTASTSDDLKVNVRVSNEPLRRRDRVGSPS